MSAMVVFGESRCLGQMFGKHNVLHSDLTRQELLHRHTRPSRETETATRYWKMLPLDPMIIILVIIMTTTVLMVLSSRHNHCESSLGSFGECMGL